MLETITGQHTLKQILQEHWLSFKAKYSLQLRDSIIEAVEKVLYCRDWFHLGYHEYQCSKGCSVKRIVPHACKSRFCSSCGKIATDNWMDKALGDFLDVPYHHLVFTIPRELRHIFAWDRQLLGLLFTSAKDALLEWCRDQIGYIPGIVMVIHTFGSDLKFNPHIHMLLTEGGLPSDRVAWIHNEFIPWKMLKARWKYHVVKSLRPKLKSMIKEQRVGREYIRLGTGSSFHSFLGYPLSENLVCLDGLKT